MTLPLVALVGRPNVGKSTLFNCLCGGRDALVAALPGLTRDRRYGRCRCGERELMLVDTAGIVSVEEDDVSAAVQRQTQTAVEEAELLLFVVDAREGLCSEDREIASRLRSASRPWLLLVNKIDGLDPEIARAEFSPLGAPQTLALSATHRLGLGAVRRAVEQALPQAAATAPATSADREAAGALRAAALGRPNVGKSTLINRLLGEERMVVGAQPGLTRDSIDISWRWGGRPCVLTDTAGVRRRRSIAGEPERDAVWMALRAMRRADAAMLLIDAAEGVTEQDLRLLGLILEGGIPAVVALNKSDLLDHEGRLQLQAQLERRLRFADFVECVRISALHGSGMGALRRAVMTAADAARRMQADTPRLNRILREALAAHPLPAAGGRRARLRYAHAGGRRPPTVIIHGSGAQRVPQSYRRYLENYFRRRLGLSGAPLRLAFRNAENPFVAEKAAGAAPARRKRAARRRRPARR